eukprot:TRINITY_DN12181_c0_g1_i4.p1 TRINITY_DN12181_c0_g1~~TRINITY_DN12181_c0_g1_i4.p1  ORF type:complete len:315 (-),score=36.10 TRINITY_DN12181_c0_g1_i4:141-1085(-)
MPEYDLYMYAFAQCIPKDPNVLPIQLSESYNQIPKSLKENHKRSKQEQGDKDSIMGIQRKKSRHGTGGAQQWVSVYNRCVPMKQRYHYNVGTQRLEVHVQRGYEDGLRICAVCACGELWAVIMDAGTNFTNQVYTVQPGKFLPKDWIIERWEAGFYITAVAGSSDGSSLVVMSQGTKYTQQSYKVSDNFPYEWIKRKWKEGFYVTSMATCKDQWAVVMSRNAGFVSQVLVLDFQYPCEGIHKRWDKGFRITALAATNDQIAFALSTLKGEQGDQALVDETQETLRTSQFPAGHVKEKWDRDLYISNMCYGRAVA